MNLVGVIGVLVILALRRGGIGHGHPIPAAFERQIVDRVSAIVSESQGELMRRFDSLDVRLTAFEQEIRNDLNNLHKRVEFLEQRDRDRDA